MNNFILITSIQPPQKLLLIKFTLFLAFSTLALPMTPVRAQQSNQNDSRSCIEPTGKLPACPSDFQGVWTPGGFRGGLGREVLRTCVGTLEDTVHKEIYRGDFCGGKRHGKGELSDTNGSWKHYGDFHNGYRHGHGVYLSPRLEYRGAIKYGFAHGKGFYSIIDATSFTYDGEFRYGLYSGKGVLKFSNGNRVEGDFLKGKMHGLIKVTWADGREFVGEAYNNNLHYGSYTIPNGAKFAGIFSPETKLPGPDENAIALVLSKGIVLSHGVVTLQDGRRYVGHLHWGRPHGSGVLYSATGSILAMGTKWVQGEISGQQPLNVDEFPFNGFETHIDLESETSKKNNCRSVYHKCWGFANSVNAPWTREGTWLYGFLHGKGRSVLSDELVQEGIFRFGRLHGEGKVTIKGGLELEGTFRNGHLNGAGEARQTPVCSEKATLQLIRYVGSFGDGFPDGEGIADFCSNNGTFRYVGQFLGGRPTGEGVLYTQNGYPKMVGFWGSRGEDNSKMKIVFQATNYSQGQARWDLNIPTLADRAGDWNPERAQLGSYVVGSSEYKRLLAEFPFQLGHSHRSPR